ncbi:hypothetical protein I3843_02G129900 [Carya illinoinensis]|uniref:Thionin-like protein 2 n=1 Tax=Carya illinoinensis TaxID=32201 RepID=A0A8T1RF94_CARIL|nr:thionin-like protein 2 [Carya illinoinensis]KAG6665305.1 hypothetical protein CIPAW_02G152000 [Carya illinoinensis]KAG6727955.1 hypothetical protein I3842_02G149100 [Carya illinoinensis]KAG7992486.1 hypothetical protein I3843_02G129900 [Carya illinoinensis]
MEETKLRSVAIVVVCLMLGMVVKDSTAYDKQKYESCFSLCCLDSFQPAFSCSLKCLKKAMKPIVNENELGNHAKERYNACRLRCAEQQCSKISTRGNPNGDQVGACLGTCSQECRPKRPQGPL